MTVEILPVTSPRLHRTFIDVPWRVHDPARHPQWVPPLRLAVRDVLDVRHNPFWADAERALFLARRGARVVGRIAAIENRAHTGFHGDRVGFFGFFECADDPEAAGALFDAAGGWLAARGLDTMRGPTNPSTNHECGVLVGGHEHHPMFMTTWNPPYYATLLERAGFVAAKELLGWRVPVGDPDFALPPLFEAHAERALGERTLRFRDLEPRHLEREIAICWDVYNAAWERNWGFVPMSRAEFAQLARDLKLLVDPRFAFAAEIDGEPAGFVLALLDYNVLFKRIPTGRLFPTGLFTLLAGRRGLRSARIMALGVKRAYRTRSIFALFVRELVRRGRAMGATDAEASWVLEDNHLMNRPLRAMGATPYRRWRLYDRPLAPAAPRPAPARERVPERAPERAPERSSALGAPA